MMCSDGDVEGVSLKWIPYTAMIMLPLQVEEKDQASAVFSFVYTKCTVGESTAIAE
jgi:hypothetical protein